MSKTKTSRTTPAARVQFECKAANAQAVYLAGSFNGWDTRVTPMIRDEDGIWSVTLPLEPGTYEYKFVIDGAWCCSPELLPEPDQTPCVHNSFGTMNFAAKVPAPEEE